MHVKMLLNAERGIYEDAHVDGIEKDFPTDKQSTVFCHSDVIA